MSGIYQKPQIRSFTGMRFLAAVAVFISHVLAIFPVVERGRIPLGGAGVSFFFLLSGFILTYVYWPNGGRPNGGTKSLAMSRQDFNSRKFYLRRFARIWPLHIVTLLLNLFLIRGFSKFFAGDYAAAKLSVNVGLLQSWIPNRQWLFPLNGVSWSLSAEAFFYLVFPPATDWRTKAICFKIFADCFCNDCGSGPDSPIRRDAIDDGHRDEAPAFVVSNQRNLSFQSAQPIT